MSNGEMEASFTQGRLLKEFSTLGVGGPARYLLEVKEIEHMRRILRYCKREALPFFILGKGSNCLFDDRGFDGLVILNKISFCQFNWPHVHVGAGYSFSLLGVQTARNGWGGLEFASGIPGSVGGALFMNAGANGAEAFDCLSEVEFLDEEGSSHHFSKEELKSGYRYSAFQEKKGAIVSATFKLFPHEGARAKQLEIVDYRTKTQPYQDQSAGCIFRNPEGGSAGALIQQCGLKGARRGGAEVSPMHANFIVNRSGATAADILELAAFVQEVVKEKSGITLEREVRCIPYQDS